jgi:mono/diheme cytochrome c family protein
MTEHATPQEPAPGSAGLVVGTTDRGPGAGHEPPHTRSHGAEGLSGAIATAQFLFTGVILLVVAGLMYTAGLHQGKGGEGGGKPSGAQPAEAVDVQTLLQSTPELVSEGKNLFSINCSSCHGTSGQGNGPAATALNPKPRDFTSGYWRYGGGVARIVQTISTGSPGTAMAPFPGIPLHDRFALAHFVRTFDVKQQQPDKPEDLAWLDQFGGGKKAPAGGGATTAVAGGMAPGDTIPIARAMALLTEPAPPPIAAAAATAPDSSEGGLLYARRCASCHGMAGEGGVRTRMLGSAPYAYVTTRPLGSMARDAGGFQKFVIRGIAGIMPGNGDLTSEQLNALYSTTQSLRARQENAARTRS